MDLQAKKPSENPVYKNSQNSYEEISEKKTSKLGYILLFIMVLFVIGVGETIFNDLKKIPARPVAPSYCIDYAIERPENITSVECPTYSGFNEVDKKFGLDVRFNSLKPDLQKIATINKEIFANQREIQNLENDVREMNKDYDLGLQEKMADELAIMEIDQIKDQLINSKSEINNLRSRNSSLTSQRSAIILQTSNSVRVLKQSNEEAHEYYLTVVAWYKFKIFLLTLVFVLPFFILSVYWYLKLKRKDSPYTIILTALTTAFSLLFLQVVVVFLYQILPMQWLGRVFTYFLEVPFLRYVVYYGSVVLVIGLFGGLVYYIQKKVFDPAKVAVRRIKDKKCPKCSFALDSGHAFCPNCGLQLKEKCENCGNQKIKYLAHCPNCGKE
jgi:hypothetical protein